MFISYCSHPNCHFQPSPTDSWFLWSLHVFLSLLPVFTLSTNFPIIAITLSNNLKSLFLTEGRMYSYWTRTVVFPLLALVPPTCVAMPTHSLEFLVGLTGSYAGAGIQYIVPAALVYYARQVLGLPWGWGSGTILRAHSSTGCWSCLCSCGPSPASCSSPGTTLVVRCHRNNTQYFWSQICQLQVTK